MLDQCLMTIFVCEILVKWYHGFFMFWKMGWNVLDFFIVVALLLGPCEYVKRIRLSSMYLQILSDSHNYLL